MNKTLISAGGLVSRVRDGVCEILLLTYPDGRLAFPKGRQDPGETLQETALREVQEETGLQGLDIVSVLGEVSYVSKNPTQAHLQKTMHIFLMTAKERPAEGEDAALWVPLTDAMERMEMEGERVILRDHAAVIRAHCSLL